MKITIEEVRRVAALAHLDLDPRTEERLRASLDEILVYMEKLNRLDTSSVPSALGVTDERPAFREDRRGESLPADRALANAPQSGEGHFKVPRVIPG